MLSSPIMPVHTKKHPSKLTIYELLVIGIAVAVCLSLALAGRGRKIRGATERFLEVIPRVAKALEDYAADHQGRFPPDAMKTACPQGLEPKYIKWDHDWHLDYDVHDNGAGGKYVCIEWCGPFSKPAYHGLCNNVEMRRKYGRGEPVPDSLNRLWLVRESAQIMPLAAPPGK